MQEAAQGPLGIYDEEQAPQKGMLQELCDAQDWLAVAGLLPQHWRAKAREFGAVRRQLRGFASIEPPARLGGGITA